MKNIKLRYFFVLALILVVFAISSCTDDKLLPDPEQIEEKDYTDPTLPDEFKDGFSITFNMRLDPIGSVDGVGTRVTSTDIMEYDNYIDLEKVRILFFICAKGTTEFDTTGLPDEIDAQGNVSLGGKKNYYIGDQDYFLFESKSRWVSQLTTAESSEANWQVTAPVFTYGNNEVYQWDKIRKALETYPFKVAVLVNRPDEVNFGNFDNKFNGAEVKFTTDRGPNWGPMDSWLPYELRSDEEKNDPNYSKDRYTINDLHHCQWDAVYASKNNGDPNTYAGSGVYTMIMKNPVSDEKTSYLEAPSENKDENGKLSDPKAYQDLMGALSYWTKKGEKVDDTDNYYFLPDKVKQGIPMYGVQIFDPIKDWKKGTPFNLSYGLSGQQSTYKRKNIHLLRSLVKLELKIPKVVLDADGNERKIEVINPRLDYSNVMARCEPLDVATPPEILWKSEADCEWENLLAYGPMINENHGGPDLQYYQKKLAWFYGAWRTWWDFNETMKNGLKDKSFFDSNGNVRGKPYPRIYNPVIQRNANASIKECMVEGAGEDDKNYYFVVYTGERNINDPSRFGESTAYYIEKSMIAFFHFQIKGDDSNIRYKIALTDYSNNQLIKEKYTKTGILLDDYKKAMADKSKKEYVKENWNWPLLRNHCYTFTVNSFGNFSDPGGLDVSVVSTEKRKAPGFYFE